MHGLHSLVRFRIRLCGPCIAAIAGSLIIRTDLFSLNKILLLFPLRVIWTKRFYTEPQNFSWMTDSKFHHCIFFFFFFFELCRTISYFIRAILFKFYYFVRGKTTYTFSNQQIKEKLLFCNFNLCFACSAAEFDQFCVSS